MNVNKWYKITALLAMVAMLGLYVVPYSYSSGISEFTLYGNVIDGGTCQPVAGAMVTTPFNGNAFNLTNTTGGYLLRLGYGNWTVTVSKANYTPISFNTPYISTGLYQFNTYLLQPGAFAVNCTETRHVANSTVPTTVTALSTFSTIPASTSLQAAGQNSQNPSNTELIAGIGVIVVVLIVLAYFALRGMGKKDAQEKTEGAGEAKDVKTP